MESSNFFIRQTCTHSQFPTVAHQPPPMMPEEMVRFFPRIFSISCQLPPLVNAEWRLLKLSQSKREGRARERKREGESESWRWCGKSSLIWVENPRSPGERDSRPSLRSMRSQLEVFREKWSSTSSILLGTVRNRECSGFFSVCSDSDAFCSFVRLCGLSRTRFCSLFTTVLGRVSAKCVRVCECCAGIIVPVGQGGLACKIILNFRLQPLSHTRFVNKCSLLH